MERVIQKPKQIHELHVPWERWDPSWRASMGLAMDLYTLISPSCIVPYLWLQHRPSALVLPQGDFSCQEREKDE